jgi:hypothetical protein
MNLGREALVSRFCVSQEQHKRTRQMGCHIPATLAGHRVHQRELGLLVKRRWVARSNQR